MAFLAFYVSYLLMGGYLFHISECPAEIQRKSQEAVRLKEFVTLFSHLEKLEDLQQRAAESPADISLQRKVVASKTEFLNLTSHLEHLGEDLRDILSKLVWFRPKPA